MAKSIVIATALTIVSVLVFTALNERRATISINIESSVYSEARVYWDSGDSFNAENSFAGFLVPGNNRLTNTVFNDVFWPLRLKLVPLSHPGNFELTEFKLRYRDCLVSIFEICSQVFHQTDSYFQQDIRTEAGAEMTGLSTGSNSYMMWEVPERLRSRKPVYILNVAIVSIALLIWGVVVWGLSRRKNIAPEKLPYSEWRNIASILLIYPAFFFLSWLGSWYVDTIGMHVGAFLMTLACFLVALEVARCVNIRTDIFPRAVISIVVAGMIVPDILFHAGVLKSWAPGARERPEYHWQLGRTFTDNYRNSALVYSNEIKEIESLILPRAVFLADEATSYYLTASIDAFAINPMYHHQVSYDEIDYFIDDSEVEVFCDVSQKDWSYREELLDRHSVSYVVVNRDRNNHNVQNSCFARNSSELNWLLEEEMVLLYQGENLSLYEVAE
jgi:hypothetical protein